MDARYDGNVLAGALSEVFTAEVTTGVVQCRGCGRSSVVAELAVYGPEPGLVARCPGCSDALLRFVRTPTAMWLDLSGTSVLRLPTPASD
jgi:Family of unknown function (DUF6510)